MTLSEKLLEIAIRRALTKPSPPSIPRTGDRAKLINCIHIRLYNKDDRKLSYNLKGINGALIVCNKLREGVYDEYCELKLSEAAALEFSAHKYFGQFDFDFYSPIKFLIWEYIGLCQVWVFRNHLFQGVFNFTTPIRTSRIELLMQFVELKKNHIIDRENQSCFGDYHGESVLTLMRKKYGGRMINHPRFNTIQYEIEAFAESLLETGDLKENKSISTYYQVSPKAMIAIANYEEENRRHSDQVRARKWMLFFTAVIALVGFKEEIYSYYGATEQFRKVVFDYFGKFFGI